MSNDILQKMYALLQMDHFMSESLIIILNTVCNLYELTFKSLAMCFATD